VDIAPERDRAGNVEDHGFRLTRIVEGELELFRFGERVEVVLNLVLVGKVHAGAGLHDRDVAQEFLVLLADFVGGRRSGAGRAVRASAGSGDHGVRYRSFCVPDLNREQGAEFRVAKDQQDESVQTEKRA
jgi:hypothetical protein